MIRDRIFDGLTFDDILLVPGYAEIHPSEVSLKSKLTRKLECNIPLLSAAIQAAKRGYFIKVLRLCPRGPTPMCVLLVPLADFVHSNARLPSLVPPPIAVNHHRVPQG